MKRRKRYIVAGLIPILLGVLMIIAIPRFLFDEQLVRQTYESRVKPEIQEREGKLNLTDLPKPEQQALAKLNKWEVVDWGEKMDWIVASAFFSVALAMILLGLVIIVFGRIKDLERFLEDRRT